MPTGRLILGLILALPLLATAANRDVPVQDPVYRLLDAALACKLLHSVHYGQRPWSELEVRRLLDEATTADETARACLDPEARQLLEHWAQLADHDHGPLPPEAHGFSLPRPILQAEMSAATSAYSTTRVSNGIGDIALKASPLDFFREGKDLPAGGSASYLEAYQSMSYGSWVSLAIAPRGGLEFGTGGKTLSTHGNLWETLLTVGTRHIELAVGRGRVLWGPAEHGGLLLSDHAPPLDMVRVRTPQAFRLPWVFRHIGTIQTSLLFAYLGRYTPKGTILSGYRVDIQPHPYVTFGLNHMVMMGGAGMVDPSPAEAITEFIGFVRPGGGTASTNHQVGADIHIRVPAWRGTQIYAAYAYEDPDADLEILFDRQAAWLAGVYLPRLTSDGSWRLRAEYWRAGAGVYRHAAYREGWTLQGHGLGNPFGGDSDAGWLTLSHTLLPHMELAARVGMVHRSSNTYQNLVDASGDRNAIVVVNDDPDELSAFGQLQLSVPLRHQLTAQCLAGYSHAWNTQFIAGQRDHNVLLSAGLQWRP